MDRGTPHDHFSRQTLLQRQIAFGYTFEDERVIIAPMAKDGVEAIGSMGNDAALAVLSNKPRLLYDYFKQLFAQVTNPPIDSLRERIVTDTTVYIGSDGDLLREKSENCRVLEVNNPVLTGVDLMKIRHMEEKQFHVETISLLYYKRTPLEQAVERLFVACDRAYQKGANIRSCRIAAWTKTTWPSRRCWRSRRCRNTWCAPKSARRCP
jgi:glutamate synthase (ferredoxin)